MKLEITDNFITDNSKEVVKGCYFLKSNNNQIYADEAVQNGAKLLSAKEAIALLGINEKIKIVGITGTNGKTTTAAAIYSTLLDLGYKAALAGTRGFFINDKEVDKKALTTAMPLKNLSYLLEATKAKCDYFVMEVSSHAIAQNRIDGLFFSLKIFTNLTQDHLDYHKTFEEYVRVKSSFFQDSTLKLINIDDGKLSFNHQNAATYAIKSPATFCIKAYSLKEGIDAVIKSPQKESLLSSPLVGEFNLYNLLAAFGAIKLLTKKDDDEIVKALANFAGVKGRVEVVWQDPLVIVDFAHTPDGMENILSSLKSKNIITVFGAGGDRDRLKRPIMGKVAQRYSKITIVTSDNPRSEKKEAIIEDIVSGMQMQDSVLIEPDRKKAITKAISLAKKGDIVAILGKGDEDYQEIDGVKHHFSDKECVEEIMEAKNDNRDASK